MLDCSPKKIAEYTDKYGVEFWQLRTPLTQYKLAGVPYGLDNGCFKRFDQKTWEKLLGDAETHRPKNARRHCSASGRLPGGVAVRTPLRNVDRGFRTDTQTPWADTSGYWARD